MPPPDVPARRLVGHPSVEVAAVEKMPVYIVYQTMWLDGSGQLVYGPDVYKKDQALIKALASKNGLFESEKSWVLSGNIVPSGLASAGAIQ